MPTGVLISPGGRAAETLTEQEYRYVRTCLEVLRGKEKDANGFVPLERRMLDLVVRGVLQGHGVRQDALAAEIASHLEQSDQAETVSGYLHDGVELHGIESEETVRAMVEFLMLLVRGGWLKDFVVQQCHELADPQVGYPTPLEVMQELGPLVDCFEQDLDAAREMLKRYPRLFPQPEK